MLQTMWEVKLLDGQASTLHTFPEFQLRRPRARDDPYKTKQLEHVSNRQMCCKQQLLASVGSCTFYGLHAMAEILTAQVTSDCQQGLGF